MPPGGCPTVTDPRLESLKSEVDPDSKNFVGQLLAQHRRSAGRVADMAATSLRTGRGLDEQLYNTCYIFILPDDLKSFAPMGAEGP